MSATAGAAMVLALSGVPAQAAQSAPTEFCGWAGTDVLTASGLITKDKSAVHNGPAAKCDVTSYRAYGSRVEIYCKYTNDVGNLWYSTTFGWIYSPYVKVDRGSAAWC
ncbi:hypothetical protein [Streptomyces prasinus]